MPTAYRKWNHTGTKALVTVIFDDGSSEVLGGKRAERASAAIVCAYHGGHARVLGLRADLTAAQSEAHRLVNTTTRRHQGATISRTPADYAVAVVITEHN
jgi:hypothetical protein